MNHFTLSTMETWSHSSLLLSLVFTACMGQQTAIITGGFNGYQGARTGDI